MRSSPGRAGCGCLIFALILIMVSSAVLLHPLSLRFLGRLLIYSDKGQFSDVLFVPKVEEDTQGEIYLHALEEIRRGNAKALWVEEASFLDLNLSEILVRVAKDRGIKDRPIIGIKLEGDMYERAVKLKEICLKKKLKKITILVPEYSSRRYAALFRDLQGNDISFLIKPIALHTFNLEKWWKDPLSRILFLREVSLITGFEVKRIKENLLKRVRSKGG